MINKKLTFVVCAILFSLLNIASAAVFSEGKHYKRVASPLKVKNPDGLINVSEVFWYGCPHCFSVMLPEKQWLKTNPKGVFYQRIAAPFGGRWTPAAKFYFASDLLGVVDEVHEPFFNAIHRYDQKRILFDKSAMIEFVARLGIDADKFERALDSFAVDQKIRTARKSLSQIGINSVPTYIVAGKYLVEPSALANYAELFGVIEFLVAKELRSQ